MTKKRVNRQPKVLRESIKREQRRQALESVHRRSSWGRSSSAAETDELTALISADADYPYDPEEEDDWPGAWPGQWTDGWWVDDDPPFTDRPGSDRRAPGDGRDGGHAREIPCPSRGLHGRR
jgi:hypothetical protein